MKNWTFGKRMAAGFGAIILIVVILGVLSAFIMSRSSATATILSRDYAKALDLVADFNDSVNDMRINVTPYVMTGAADRLKSLQDAIVKLNDSSKKLTEHLKSSPTLAEPNKLLAPTLNSVQLYQQNVEKTIRATEIYMTTRQRSAELGPKWNQATENLIKRQYQHSEEMLKNKPTPEQSLQALRLFYLTAEIRAASNGVRMANARGQLYRDVSMFKAADSNFKRLDAALAEIEPNMKEPEDVQALADVRSCMAEYQKGFLTIIESFTIVDESTKLRNALAKELKANSHKLYDSILDLTITSTNSTASQLNYGQLLVTVGVVIAFVVACLLALLITRSTSGVLKRIINQLSAGAMETASAAEQLSTGSQTLALGANEQAASLEETSASMEEMTSMTKRNAENALNAKNLAQEARSAAEKAAMDIASMSTGLQTVAQSSDELSKAMDQIRASSNAITQIMKTIDEIAFQTNILSINAAVEAARAGEAGSGFAVVADEVRALARRSADAAKETAKMIKESSDSSQHGMTVTDKVSRDLSSMNQMANQVNSSLQAIVDQVRKVDEVIAEISTACQEQSQGISQVNTALTQMDKVTQSNAASAEESASAAEEVSAQAEEAKSAVNELQSLVGQNTGANATAVHHASPARSTATTRPALRNPHQPHPMPSRNKLKTAPAPTQQNHPLHDAMDEHFKDV